MNSKDEFKAPDRKEIIDILKLFDESDFESLRLEMGEFKLVVAKDSNGFCDEPPADFQIASGRAALPEPVVSNRMKKQEKTETVSSVPPSAPVEIFDQADNLQQIKAPMLGIFYRASKPGAPPFVEVGDYVTEEDTVCIIEVMKLFNSIKAGVRGRVVKILVENNSMVEYDQPLFFVDPAGPGNQ